MIIYKTTNIINGKIYIGKDEKNDSKYLGSGKILKAAIKKYGRSNFSKEVLEQCNSRIELCEREKYWIEIYNSQNPQIGYNIAVGGSGGDTFSGQDDTSKDRISNIRSINAKNQKSFYSIPMKDKLIQAYGSELGELKYKEWKENASRINKERAQQKEDMLREVYLTDILNLFKDFTIMEIYQKLDKKVPSRLISKFLKESGIDLNTRKGVNRGSLNGMSKLSNADIQSIRELKGQYSGHQIAKMYNISATQACAALRGDTYEPKHQGVGKNFKKD
jgi:group I intron endonuclease